MRGPGRASPSGWDRDGLLRSRRTDEGWESTGVCGARKRRPASCQTPKEKHSVYAAFAVFVGFADTVFFCFAVAFACLAANSAVTA